MRQRTLARELALQALFQDDIWSRIPGLVGEDPAPLPGAEDRDPAQVRYAEKLVAGVRGALTELDDLIGRAATNWKLSRLACVDRNVLRLGLYELLYAEDVPPKVVIDEAINLAKKFSTEQSGAFVNGVLDRIYNDIGRECERIDGSPNRAAGGEES